MNILSEQFDDLTEPLGIGIGALLILIGLGTLSGMPWVTNNDIVASVFQIGGVLLTIALGAGLAYLSWNGRA